MIHFSQQATHLYSLSVNMFVYCYNYVARTLVNTIIDLDTINQHRPLKWRALLKCFVFIGNN